MGSMRGPSATSPKYWPIELSASFPGPVELKRSLRASSINEPGAMGRFQAAAAECDLVVGKARKAATRSFDRLEGPKITRPVEAFVWSLGWSPMSEVGREWTLAS